MTRTRLIGLLAGAALLLIGALIAGCGGSSGGGNSQNATAASPKPAAAKTSATVNIGSTSLGKVLVDSQGRTLYLFKADSGTKSMCNGACATDWPPLTAKGKPSAGGGAKASLLGTSKRSDGTMQVTYNGHPVYRFFGDHKAGDTNGQGQNFFGGLWYAVSASGNQVTTMASSNNSSGGSSGY
jgi:predicted lipoprotein with Yx(FWY)xxD motif